MRKGKVLLKEFGRLILRGNRGPGGSRGLGMFLIFETGKI